MSATADTTRKLAAARARYDKAKAAFDAAEGKVGLPTDDPGALSGIKVRNPGRHAAKQAVAWDRALDRHRDMETAREAMERLERRLINEQRDARIRAEAHRDVEALKPGDIVRYESHGRPRGVGRVLRVNKTTVTLQAPAPGMDQPRIPYGRIVETQHQAQGVAS